MTRVVHSPRARRDITDVLSYTKARWGRMQAREYRELIRDALRAIATDPSCGKVRGTWPGIFSQHIKQPGRDARHIVFYRVGLIGSVEIVRFLHDSMDFDQHLR